MRLRWLFAALCLSVGAAYAQTPVTFVDAARGPVAIPDTTRPPALGNAVNDDARQPRHFDMQPPIIPHRVDGYQIDKNFNKCLDCHAKARTAFSGAIPVSPTHYMDRSGKVLEQVSTRRYFCLQCHVSQEAAARPLVGNSFQGVDSGRKRP